jgi:hypothetical protein
MTNAQKKALAILKRKPIPNPARLKIQERVLEALADDGLAKFYPTGNPPAWKATAEGRRTEV